MIEWPNGLLQLQEHEMIIHDLPAEEYYVFPEKDDAVTKVE